MSRLHDTTHNISYEDGEIEQQQAGQQSTRLENELFKQETWWKYVNNLTIRNYFIVNSICQ